jgi:hypothetical protein
MSTISGEKEIAATRTTLSRDVNGGGGEMYDDAGKDGEATTLASVSFMTPFTKVNHLQYRFWGAFPLLPIPWSEDNFSHKHCSFVSNTMDLLGFFWHFCQSHPVLWLSGESGASFPWLQISAKFG